MQSFATLSALFEKQFNRRHFPQHPANLYDASQYSLGIGGKRVRPVCVLMGNELFSDIDPDAYQVANAIELFHNFSLIHDDIMDKAPLRRGEPTVHKKFGETTALLAGDVMLVEAYEYINKIKPLHLQKILTLFRPLRRLLSIKAACFYSNRLYTRFFKKPGRRLRFKERSVCEIHEYRRPRKQQTPDLKHEGYNVY